MLSAANFRPRPSEFDAGRKNMLDQHPTYDTLCDLRFSFRHVGMPMDCAPFGSCRNVDAPPDIPNHKKRDFFSLLLYPCPSHSFCIRGPILLSFIRLERLVPHPFRSTLRSALSCFISISNVPKNSCQSLPVTGCEVLLKA